MRNFVIGLFLGILLVVSGFNFGYLVATTTCPTCPRCQQILNDTYEFDLDNLRSC
jgi:hypothetical protein